MIAAENRPHRATVAVVGGGLAGMAAAVALCDRGLRVELFEGRKHLGGRAGSFRDPKIGQLVDYCQHVSMGCCTNLADFCRRIEVHEHFSRDSQLHFFGPEGIRSDFGPCRWLPAPLHLVPGLMRLRFLTFGERLGIVGAMRRLAKEPASQETVGAWLRRQGQSPRAIERFWTPVLVSALSETLDRASLAAAQKVFLDGFLASRRAHELDLPQVPLGEIFHHRAVAWMREHGVGIHLGTRIRRIDGDARRATGLVLGDGTQREFDFLVVAVPWHRVGSLFPDAMLSALPQLADVKDIRPAPITAVHLWFDRPITRLPHAVLVGKMSQWVFSGSSNNLPEGSRPGHYYQVVISASHALAGRGRRDILAEVRQDLQSIWPDAQAAKLLHWRIIAQPAAVFSMRPGLEHLRPAQQTPVENLILAGDWTSTGWPATMEGAVRSGYLAAEALLKRLGRDDRILVPDLPRGRLARLLC